MTAAEKGPQRTCIACRKAGDKKQFVRYVVAPDGEVLVDYRQRLPGRGAYTCISWDCLQTAVARNSFQRSFKGQCHDVDATSLLEQLNAAVEQKIFNLIGMSRKSKQFIAGSNAVVDALKKGTSLALIVMATDISTSIKTKIETLAIKKKIYTAHLSDKQKIGQMLGKEERSVMAVQPGLLADSLLTELHVYRRLVREN
ncbi:LSU ribosomal protein L7AE [Desulfuromusa kysingii]|uniref:LSU ribosomal protein L7AE n=1 Tax=Desulfuromusa kysingii TaxID=37625 RepID=A0A1H4D1N8_9BACT|nr:DUF448 domain-containing protein [Desulfuromusa kysingii]SEA66349.1 LSU ribosomal protein L7AE [Desulfuromusa kysingii]